MFTKERKECNKYLYSCIYVRALSQSCVLSTKYIAKTNYGLVTSVCLPFNSRTTGQIWLKSDTDVVLLYTTSSEQNYGHTFATALSAETDD